MMVPKARISEKNTLCLITLIYLLSSVENLGNKNTITTNRQYIAANTITEKAFFSLCVSHQLIPYAPSIHIQKINRLSDLVETVVERIEMEFVYDAAIPGI